MVSTRRDQTRDRILAAARRLLVERGYHGVGIEEIARAAGVTRQAVYSHHFASKADLLLALVDYVGRVEKVQETFVPAFEASSGLEMLDLAVGAVGAVLPKIVDVVRVLDGARATDDAARAAWDNRMALRRAGVTSAVCRLESEGLLKRGWTIETTTDLVWTLLSSQVHDLLVRDCRWSVEQYVERMREVLRAAVVVDAGTTPRASAVAGPRSRQSPKRGRRR